MSIDLTTSPVTPDLVRLFPPAAGEVFLPGDPGYDTARQAWNVAVDQRPAAVAVPADCRRGRAPSSWPPPTRSAGRPAEHRSQRRAARRQRPRRRRPGVDAADDAASTVDAERRIARAEGGALWLDVMEAAAPHGLARCTVRHRT